jgi:hypothetical protein
METGRWMRPGLTPPGTAAYASRRSLSSSDVRPFTQMRRRIVVFTPAGTPLRDEGRGSDAFRRHERTLFAAAGARS